MECELIRLPPGQNNRPRPESSRKVLLGQPRSKPAHNVGPCSLTGTRTLDLKFERSRRRPSVFLSGETTGGAVSLALTSRSTSLALDPFEPDRRSTTHKSPRDLAWGTLAGGNGPFHGRPDLELLCISSGWQVRPDRPVHQSFFRGAAAPANSSIGPVTHRRSPAFCTVHLLPCHRMRRERAPQPNKTPRLSRHSPTAPRTASHSSPTRNPIWWSTTTLR